MSFRLVPKSVTLNDLERRNGSYFAFLPNLVVTEMHCVKVVDKAITMDNLRLLCLVVKYVCRGTARRPRYKYSMTARWKLCSRFINSRLNAKQATKQNKHNETSNKTNNSKGYIQMSIIGNLKVHKTLLSSICLFGDLVLDMQQAS